VRVHTEAKTAVQSQFDRWRTHSTHLCVFSSSHSRAPPPPRLRNVPSQLRQVRFDRFVTDMYHSHVDLALAPMSYVSRK